MKTTVADILKKYSSRIDRLDLELLIADTIKKPREFVLTYPEYKLPTLKIKNLALKIARRMRDEPLAYILGSREFFGFPFLVSPATLIPRPETELMVEMALNEVKSQKSKVISVIDIGTGSGNIIISLATNQKLETINYYGIDISNEALKIAKKNAQLNGVAAKIKFLHGNLLAPIIENCEFKIENSRIIILANLPYLSNAIYRSTHPTVKKFEPKSALFSPKEGLAHYEKLLQQLKQLPTTRLDSRKRLLVDARRANYQLPTTLYMEISPEQKTKFAPLIKKYFPEATIEFQKDLAQKWRICKISIK